MTAKPGDVRADGAILTTTAGWYKGRGVIWVRRSQAEAASPHGWVILNDSEEKRSDDLVRVKRVET